MNTSTQPPEGAGESRSKAKATAKSTTGVSFLCSSELAREKRPDTALIQTTRAIVDVYRWQASSYTGAVYKSGMSERSQEGQRGHPKSQAGYQAASAAVAVHAPSRGRVEVLRSGQPGMDAGLAAPGHGWPMAAGPRSRTGARACRATARHRTTGAKALGYLPLLQVTRRKGETISGRHRRNGYAHNPKRTNKNGLYINRGRSRYNSTRYRKKDLTCGLPAW